MDDLLEKVTFRQLRLFLTAASCLSFQETSRIHDLTPSAISMQMSRLSENLGVLLFVKSGRQTILTSEGKAFIPYATKVLESLKEGKNALHSIHDEKINTVNIAMVTTSRNFGPHLISKFDEYHPNIRLNIDIANRQTVLSKLENAHIDLAIMGRRPNHLDVDTVSFSEHPYVLIASPKHPLANKTQVKPKQLEENVFIVREDGSGTRMVHDQYCTGNSVKPQNLIVMDSNENIKQAVMADMGIAFISKHTISLELQVNKLIIIDVVGLPEFREWFVANLKGRELSLAAKYFQSFIRDEGRRFMNDFFAS